MTGTQVSLQPSVSCSKPQLLANRLSVSVSWGHYKEVPQIRKLKTTDESLVCLGL